MFRGGCTLVIDLRSGLVQHVVRKSVTSEFRRDAETAFRLGMGESLMGMYLSDVNLADNSRTFALLHASEGDDFHG
jgi:hypothetical protein